jgi:hypothetical protein
LQEAREQNSSVLIAANYRQILNAPYGTYVYGPVVDSAFAPASLASSAAKVYAKDVKVLAAHNTYEGVLFADLKITNDPDVAAFIHRTLGPGIQVSLPPTWNYSTPNIDALPISLSHRPIWEINTNYTACEGLRQGLYLERSISSQVRWVPAYTTSLERFILFPSEAFLSCNAPLLAHTGREPSFEYDFPVPPAPHGNDLAYTFCNGLSISVMSAGVAKALQELIGNFFLTGVLHTSRSNITVPPYGAEGMLLNLNITMGIMKDTLANPRCAWFQKAFFY